MRRNTFTIELSAAGGKPPTEFRLFAKGYNETTKGIFKFDDDSALSVMAKAADVGNDFCIDYDHGMLSWMSVDPAESGKAAGWFTPTIRDGELWAANVSWTPKASRMLAHREYRYISPAFDLDDDNRITRLVNAALTNIPATKNAPPLVLDDRGNDTEGHDLNLKEKKSMKKILLAALGLAPSVDQATALAAINAKNERIKTLDAKVGSLEQKIAAAEVREKEVLALSGKDNHSEALGVLRAHKESAGAMTERLTVLDAELTKLKSTSVASELEQLIVRGKEDGKILPPMETWARETGAKDITQLKAFLAAAVPMPRGARPPVPDNGSEVTLSDIEKDTAKKFGRDPKEYLEAKKKAIEQGAWPFPQ